MGEEDIREKQYRLNLKTFSNYANETHRKSINLSRLVIYVVLICRWLLIYGNIDKVQSEDVVGESLSDHVENTAARDVAVPESGLLLYTTPELKSRVYLIQWNI